MEGIFQFVKASNSLSGRPMGTMKALERKNFHMSLSYLFKDTLAFGRLLRCIVWMSNIRTVSPPIPSSAVAGLLLPFGRRPDAAPLDRLARQLVKKDLPQPRSHRSKPQVSIIPPPSTLPIRHWVARLSLLSLLRGRMLACLPGCATT